MHGWAVYIEGRERGLKDTLGGGGEGGGHVRVHLQEVVEVDWRGMTVWRLRTCERSFERFDSVERSLYTWIKKMERTIAVWWA